MKMTEVNTISKLSKRLIKFLPFYAPALLIYTIFLIYPAVSSVYYSMTNWTGIGKSFDFVGLDNFIQILKESNTWLIFLQTLEYTFFSIVIGNALGFLVSLIFDKNLKITAITKTVFFMPFVFNALVVGYLWSYMYSPSGGTLYQLLHMTGLDFLAVPWLGMKSTVIPAISFALMWQNTGSCALIYLAGLRSISPSYYEAASIDGAGRFTILKNITIPLLVPSITVNTLMGFVGTMKLFDIVFVMTNGGPATFSDTITTYIYRLAFQMNQYGSGTALGVLLFLFICSSTFILSKFFKGIEVQH